MAFGLLPLFLYPTGMVVTRVPDLEWLTQPELWVDPAGERAWDATYRALQRADCDYTVTSLRVIGTTQKGEGELARRLPIGGTLAMPDDERIDGSRRLVMGCGDSSLDRGMRMTRWRGMSEERPYPIIASWA